MNTRAMHDHRHRPHVIGSLNPVWCLKPHSGQKGGSRRISDDSTACPHFVSVIDCPASPKISCMGQITRSRKPSLPFTPASTRDGSNLFKFSRLLSGRSFSSPQPVTSNRDCGSLRRVTSQRAAVEVCVADMDPPRPVVRPSTTDRNAEHVSIWSRRRRGGQALAGLQLQKHQISISRTDI